MILNATIPPLTKYCSPSYLWQSHKRKQLVDNSQASKLNQQEANELMQEPEFDLCQNYSQIQVTILVTVYYCGVLPIILFISLIGLCLNYWVDKYLLLRRSSRPKALSRELPESMISYLNLATFLFAYHNWSSQRSKRPLNGFAEYLSPLAFVVATIIILLPQDTLIRLLHRGKGVSKTTPFDEARLQFVTDYDRENPATKDEAVSEWIKASQSNLSLYETYMNVNAGEAL